MEAIAFMLLHLQISYHTNLVRHFLDSQDLQEELKDSQHQLFQFDCLASSARCPLDSQDVLEELKDLVLQGLLFNYLINLEISFTDLQD